MDCCSQPGLKPFAQVRQHILDSVVSPEVVELVNLEDSMGRVLAKTVFSSLSVPPFDNSAMDGYALSYDDLVREGGRVLVQSQAIFAGDSPLSLVPGTCARIMTGAPMPEGADTVVMQENVLVNEKDGEKWITFTQDIKRGSNVRQRGSDVSVGDVVLESGVRLQSVHIAQLAVLGIAQVHVFRKLSVAIFSTGDELVSPGTPLESGQIYDSNRIAVISMLRNLGVNIFDFGILPDQPDKLREIMRKASEEADVIVSSGGVSVGEADYTKDILDELGQVEFWKLAIKPGKPFAYGKIGDTDFMGLPGNPVSALVTFYQLAVPALVKRMGADWCEPVQLRARLTDGQLKKKPGRLDFQRGNYRSDENGDIIVASSGHQGSAIFTSMVQSNCFIVLERERGSVDAGEWVTIEPYQWPL